MLDFEKYKDKIESIDASEIKDRIADMVAGSKVREFFRRNPEPVVVEEKKKKCKLCTILTVIGCIVAVAAIAYAIYHFLIRKPDYLEDFDDEDFDDFDDDSYDLDEDDSNADAGEGAVTE